LNPQFRERPVDIDTFVYSEHYLNLPAKQVRPKIMEMLREIFSDILDNKKYNEAIIIGGIGIGKSFISSICMSYMLHILGCLVDPQKYFGLAPGSAIQLMNMSINEKQARAVVFGEIKARIDNSPWFKNRFMYDTNVQSELKFPRKIFIIPGNSQETFFEGYNIFGGVIDEADSHVKTPDKDCAEEGYNAIIKRMSSRFGNRGLLVVIGSPKSKHGFLVNKYNETENDKRVFRAWIPYWESPSPSMHYSGETFEYRGIQVPIEHKPDWDRNPEKAMRDLAAVPSEAVEPFFAWSEKIEQNVNPLRVNPTLPTGRWRKELVCSDSKPRVVHIDLGINRNRGDACGFAMGHIREWIAQDGDKLPIIYIDLMERLTAPPGSEIMIADVRQRVYELIRRGFNIIQVTFDGWQCQLGSNKVKLLDGTSLKIKDIKEKSWVYGYDFGKNSIIPVMCNPARKTGIKVPIYKITLDNGEDVSFTPEHLILMRDGSYKKVIDLQVGDSLMPLYLRKYPLWEKSFYEQIYQPDKKYRKWEYTHRVVAKHKYGDKIDDKNLIIHHKDFNHFNNNPDNLVLMDKTEHILFHQKQAIKNGYKISLALKNKPKSKKHNLSVSNGVKKQWKNRTKQEKILLSEKISKKIKMLWKNEDYKKQMSESHIGKIGYWRGKNRSKETIEKIRRTKFLKNHKVVKIGFNGYDDVYDIEVPETHNFALDAGIFTHNSTESIQQLKKKKIEADVLSVDKDISPYEALKEAIYEGRLDYYYYKPFIEECQRLELVEGGKVNHPPKGSKDTSDAVAGVVFNLMNNKKAQRSGIMSFKFYLGGNRIAPEYAKQGGFNA